MSAGGKFTAGEASSSAMGDFGDGVLQGGALERILDHRIDFMGAERGALFRRARDDDDFAFGCARFGVMRGEIAQGTAAHFLELLGELSLDLLELRYEDFLHGLRETYP